MIHKKKQVCVNEWADGNEKWTTIQKKREYGSWNGDFSSNDTISLSVLLFGFYVVAEINDFIDLIQPIQCKRNKKKIKQP